jgi:hypothetical protein
MPEWRIVLCTLCTVAIEVPSSAAILCDCDPMRHTERSECDRPISAGQPAPPCRSSPAIRRCACSQPDVRWLSQAPCSRRSVRARTTRCIPYRALEMSLDVTPNAGSATLICAGAIGRSASASTRQFCVGQAVHASSSQQFSPRHASRPSWNASAAMTSAASGSAHHHPTVALSTSPIRSTAER